MLVEVFLDYKVIKYILITLVLASCNGETIEEVKEVSCSTATGLWTVSSASCNDVKVDNGNLVYFLFNSQTSISQTKGTTECASTFNWDLAIGEDLPSFELNGSGQLSCSANGEQVSSCASDVNSCNSFIDVTGIKNNFSLCVIRNGAMELHRTVSSINNPDNLSYCADGEEEVVTLTKATNIDLDPDQDPDINDDGPLALLRVVGPNPTDFGPLAIGNDHSLSLTISNMGNAPANSMTGQGLEVPFQFLGGSFPGQGGSCTSSLGVNESCTIVVEFVPQSVGVFADTLQILYDNGDSIQTLSHGVLGAGSNSLALLILSHGPYFDFGKVQVSSVKSHIFSVTNTGGGVATQLQVTSLSAPFQFVGGSYPGTAGTCGLTLAAGSSCDLDVEFAPESTAPFNGVLQIQYDDGYLSQSSDRNIFGTGIN